MTDLLSQRIFQTACGYIDGNDANNLRRDPMFKLAVGRAPLQATTDLASGTTFSRLENRLSRKDIDRLAKGFVEAFIASYAAAPQIIVLDMDHSEDATHGQQELAFYTPHYGNHCYLPLFIFEGLSGKFVTAVLRPGKRPTGRENAAIVKRVLRLIRQSWPQTRIVLRGDGHFSNPELMALRQPTPIWTSSSGWPATRCSRPRHNRFWLKPAPCIGNAVKTRGEWVRRSRPPRVCMRTSTTGQLPGRRRIAWC